MSERKLPVVETIEDPSLYSSEQLQLAMWLAVVLDAGRLIVFEKPDSDAS